ncbi:hypothetical protein KPA97_29090, partial [Burkholderia cenocepacia]|nr:hypothetical protein [Burkholderia cenocepacia]
MLHGHPDEFRRAGVRRVRLHDHRAAGRERGRRIAARYARLIHTDLAHLREEIVGILRGHGGRVSVGVIMGAVPRLTDAISTLVARHPEMSVEIVEDTSEALLSEIDAGRLDLAICRTTISRTPQLYDSVKLQDETLAVVANVRHPLKGAKKLALRDLAEYR